MESDGPVNNGRLYVNLFDLFINNASYTDPKAQQVIQCQQAIWVC